MSWLLVSAVAPLALIGCGAAGTAKETPASTKEARPGAITARGRLEPKDGIRRVNGPSDIVAVVAILDVAQGDHVAAGQRIAVMDTFAPRQARVAQSRARIEADKAAVAAFEAELARAEAEERRNRDLSAKGVVSQSDRELSATRLDVARAHVAQSRGELDAARAELATAEVDRDLAVVRAPISGQVLKVETHPGEKIGPEGIVTLGQTGAMYALAQVYETDVTRVRVGQRAVVRSAAFGRDLTGKVERIGLKVGRLDAVGTDPGARSDARVVEVEVRLDDSRAASGMTYLEVEVLIEP